MKIKLDQMEQAAKAKGFQVRKNTQARLYGRSVTNQAYPLVVDCKDSYDIGFSESQMEHDEHSGSTRRALAQIMPEYTQRTIEEQQYEILETTVVGDEVIMIADR